MKCRVIDGIMLSAFSLMYPNMMDGKNTRNDRSDTLFARCASVNTMDTIMMLNIEFFIYTFVSVWM